MQVIGIQQSERYPALKGLHQINQLLVRRETRCVNWHAVRVTVLAHLFIAFALSEHHKTFISAIERPMQFIAGFIYLKYKTGFSTRLDESTSYVMANNSFKWFINYSPQTAFQITTRHFVIATFSLKAEDRCSKSNVRKNIQLFNHLLKATRKPGRWAHSYDCRCPHELISN
jgi:hypothetical protein